MSAQQAARVATPARRPTPAATPAPAAAPRLRLVRAPQQARTRVPFVLACMAVLAGALLAALLLNTQMAQSAYVKYDLSNQLGRLQQDQKELTAQLDAKSSPSQIAKAARAIGMVPAPGTGWITLKDGTVRAAPSAAKAG
ncbi:hypothetical protein [Cellulomonas alba]|uniref:Cell division protein FtsL n=1 Tax=Cellulomonas alba TaxID=3053467 RepID=A0ABT7SKW7_9CELL|nr:hypothetical protein [Cellulomonas alba]MDM7856187.1 hypothetical protein [Cellulomonas alba]